MKTLCMMIVLLAMASGISFAGNVISLQSVEQANIETIEVDCSEMDMDQVRVVLVHHGAVPWAGYFSGVSFAVYDLDGNLIEVPYFEARPDIFGDTAFINQHNQYEPMHSQFVGPSQFVFGMWEDPAFKDIFKRFSCQQLQGIRFNLGFSAREDWSDYMGARFVLRHGGSE